MTDADMLVNQFGEIVESRCGSAGAHLEHMSKSATYSARSLDLRLGSGRSCQPNACQCTICPDAQGGPR